MTVEELYRKFEKLTVDMVVEEKHDILECASHDDGTSNANLQNGIVARRLRKND